MIDKDCFQPFFAEDAVAYVPDDQLEAYTEAFESAGSAVSVQPSGKNAVVVENNGYAEAEFEFDASTGTITRYNGFATYLAIPETIGGAPVKAIGPEAFAHHYYLALLELPEGLETIGDSAFYNCETLGTCEVPLHAEDHRRTTRSTTPIKAACWNCRAWRVSAITRSISPASRASLELPEGLKTIGDSAFETCSNMGADLYLPSTLEAIGSNAFKGDLLHPVRRSWTARPRPRWAKTSLRAATICTTST